MLVEIVQTLPMELEALQTNQPVYARQLATAIRRIEVCHTSCAVRNMQGVIFTGLSLPNLSRVIEGCLCRALVEANREIVEARTK